MPQDRLKIIPGLYIVLLETNDVLLLRRFNTGFADGNYTLPGGHLDKNETYIDAVIREMREETGVILEKKDLQLAHVLHRKQDGDRIDLFFVADKWTGQPTIAEPDKCDDIQWFPIKNLPNNTIPYIKQAAEKIIKKTLYSEFGF
jgi:mutator protein MutT